MAWRIIQQPNKLFARFSEVVDHVTDYNMDQSEVIDLCQQEYDLSIESAQGKLQRAMDEQERWMNAIRTIRAVHGKDEADELVRECSQIEENKTQ